MHAANHAMDAGGCRQGNSTFAAKDRQWRRVGHVTRHVVTIIAYEEETCQIWHRSLLGFWSILGQMFVNSRLEKITKFQNGGNDSLVSRDKSYDLQMLK